MAGACNKALHEEPLAAGGRDRDESNGGNERSDDQAEDNLQNRALNPSMIERGKTGI